MANGAAAAERAVAADERGGRGVVALERRIGVGLEFRDDLRGEHLGCVVVRLLLEGSNPLIEAAAHERGDVRWNRPTARGGLLLNLVEPAQCRPGERRVNAPQLLGLIS